MIVTQLPRFIGMVHLPPLPGSPRSSMSIAECEQNAIADARALAAGGADGMIIENFGDAPFRAGRVDPHVIASMTRIALRIREVVDLPLGINVLRNDGIAALGIAQSVGASFIRVNILSGVMATDQGLITGEADDLMRLRRSLRATGIKVIADVLVKHALPFPGATISDAVDDAIERGLADAVVVSGSATGKPASSDDFREAVEAARYVPVYVGSGATAETISDLMPPAYGAIIGTALKFGGDVSSPVDPKRVSELASRFREAVE